MKNKIIIMLFIATLINTHLIGCLRNSVKPDSRQHETVFDLARNKNDTNQEIVGRDDHYFRYANGVVYDQNTNLEWYAGPEKNTNFDDAVSWVEKLNVGGGNWRMPTRPELMTLYKKGAGLKNMTPLIETTGMWVWSGDIKDSSIAWAFNFDYGYGHWDFRDNAKYFRVFAVRFR